jgi:hypothetical protein
VSSERGLEVGVVFFCFHRQALAFNYKSERQFPDARCFLPHKHERPARKQHPEHFPKIP